MDLINLATSVDPDTSVGFTATVIIAGLGIVLGTLAVLIIVFYAFGAIMSKSQNSAKKKAAKKAEEENKVAIPLPKIPTPAPAPSANDGAINPEVVAAISAVVHELEGAGSVVTSITPVRKRNPITSRNPWANAAVIENTKPF